MGRRLSLADDSLINPMVSLSLFAAAMAAVIALIGGLCSFWRKSRPPDVETQTQSQPENTTGESNHLQSKEPIKRQTNQPEENNTTDLNRELPLPPARKMLRETYSCNNMMAKSMSTRKMNMSSTMKISRTLSMREKNDVDDDNKVAKKKKFKTENSILGRPIILGEKCRVPNDDDDDEDLGLKGQRMRAYHPRSTSSITLSRMNSKINGNAILGSHASKDRTRKEEKQDDDDEEEK